MAVVTRLFLLATLHVLSASASIARTHNPDSLRDLKVTTRGVKWLEEGRSVLVRLETPDLPLWNPTEQIGEALPNALILNFTLTPDSHTLLLQDQPILPLPNPHIPPRLEAPQTTETLGEFENEPGTDIYKDLPHFALDYERLVHPRDDASIRYYNHVPVLTLQLLGAGIAGYNTLLKDEHQRYIKVTLKDHNSPTTNPVNYKLEITNVALHSRDERNPFTHPDSLKPCTMWSYRCEDFGDTPWYQYVFRQAFDEYGKIGSLRHSLCQRWGTMTERFGYWKALILMVVVGSMVLSPGVYAVYVGVKFVLEGYQRRMNAMAASWVADEEEAERFLVDSEDEDDRQEGGIKGDSVEKREMSEKAVEELAEGSSVIERPLPPIPVKTEEF